MTSTTPPARSPRDTLLSLLRHPREHWPDDSYFHRRNREKLARSLARLRKEQDADDAELVERLLATVLRRRDAGIGTLYVMSNGSSGCHHLGSLLGDVPRFSMTDEVYLSPRLIREAGQSTDHNVLVDAVNVLHLGTLGHRAEQDWVVNIGHLRHDVAPSHLRALAPADRFALLLRNPYDVAISRAYRKPDYRAASGADSVDDLSYLADQAGLTASHFTRAVKVRWDAVVRYEALMSEPRHVLAELATCVRVDVPPGAMSAAILRHSRAYRSDGVASEHDNLNPAPKPRLGPAASTMLGDLLSEAAGRWGYQPNAEVADAWDAAVRSCGRDRRTLHLWRPLFDAAHFSQAAYERLRAGEIRVHDHLATTARPVDDDDWTADPLDNRTWRLHYQSLGWLLSFSWAIDAGLDVEQNLDEIASTLLSWIERNVESASRDEMAWDDHATADRAAVMAYLLHHHLSTVLDRAGRDRIVRALDVHIETIAEYRRSERWIDSNHGAFHAMGALNVALVLDDHPVGRRAWVVALEYLTACLPRLVHPDGVAVEQSVAYHTIDLELLRAAHAVLTSNSVDVDIGIDIPAVERSMVSFNRAISGVDRARPSIGDTPYGDAIPVHALETHLTNDATETAADAPTCVYPSAGVVVLRSGDESPGAVGRATFVTTGARIHHGHFDRLSVTFHLDGHEVLVDAGGPYAYGHSMRFGYFVSTLAHNTVLLDGATTQPGARLVRVGGEQGIHWAVGEIGVHQGHRVRRAVALVDGVSLCVFDRIDPISRDGSDHVFTTLWHLDPAAQPSVRPGPAGAVVDLPHDRRPMRLGTTSTAIEIVTGRPVDDPQGPQGWVTTGPGQLEPAPVLVAEHRGARHQNATWVAPHESTVEAASATSIRIDRPGRGTVTLSYDGGDAISLDR